MDYLREAEQTRRFRHRSILLFILLATLPCYIIGGIMLGVAPNDNDDISDSVTLPPADQRTSERPTETVTITLAANLTPSLTLLPTSTGQPLPNTPFQFHTPTPFPSQPIPTASDAPTLTDTPTTTITTTATATTTVTATVQQNQNPVFDVPPQDIALEIGQTGTVSFTFSDPDGDPVSFTANADDTGIATITQFGVSSFDVLGMAAGVTSITITLEDDQGGNASVAITATISAANNNPTFDTEPTDVVVNQFESATVNLVFSDPDGDPVMFEAVPAFPDIASITPLDGTSFSVAGIAPGSTSVTITLSDGRGGTDSRTINVTVNSVEVNQNPVFDQIPLPITIAAGDSDIVFLFVSDPDGDSVTMTVVSANMGVATATWLDNASFTVQGVAAGITTFTITLEDGQGGVAQEIVEVTVTAPPNNPPQFTVPPTDLTLAVNATQTVTFSFNDPDGDPVTISAISAAPGTAAVISTGASSFDVQGDAEGTTSITVTLDDGRGGTDSATINIMVTP